MKTLGQFFQAKVIMQFCKARQKKRILVLFWIFTSLNNFKKILKIADFDILGPLFCPGIGNGMACNRDPGTGIRNPGMSFQEFPGSGTGPGGLLENQVGTGIDLLIPVSPEWSRIYFN